jgi:hypothetical protein
VAIIRESQPTWWQRIRTARRRVEVCHHDFRHSSTSRWVGRQRWRARKCLAEELRSGRLVKGATAPTKSRVIEEESVANHMMTSRLAAQEAR